MPVLIAASQPRCHGNAPAARLAQSTPECLRPARGGLWWKGVSASPGDRLFTREGAAAPRVMRSVDPRRSSLGRRAQFPRAEPALAELERVCSHTFDGGVIALRAFIQARLKAGAIWLDPCQHHSGTTTSADRQIDGLR